jgi:hypothetical protein
MPIGARQGRETRCSRHRLLGGGLPRFQFGDCAQNGFPEFAQGGVVGTELPGLLQLLKGGAKDFHEAERRGDTYHA